MSPKWNENEWHIERVVRFLQLTSLLLPTLEYVLKQKDEWHAHEKCKHFLRLSDGTDIFLVCFAMDVMSESILELKKY